MNILIIPGFFRTKDRPTIGSFFWDQARALKRAGHNVTILRSEEHTSELQSPY